MNELTARVRAPAVAGRFYPRDAGILAADVDAFVAAGHDPDNTHVPKAIVVPHAGYPYSGPVAGVGYATVGQLRGVVEHVVLVGPAHYVATHGLVTVSVDALDTPLGSVRVDTEARRVALGLSDVSIDDRAHAPEHSLEVHLPFLQRVLGDVTVLPLLAGQVAADTVARVINALWGGPDTLIVVSTDLSHYLDYDTATVRDRQTATAIVDGDSEAIEPEDACGAAGVRGLLLVVHARGLHTELLDLRNSGDTAGPRDHVVGYAAFAVTEDVA